MEITYRGLWTLIHGMGFGAFFLLGSFAALLELGRLCFAGDASSARFDSFFKWYLLAVALLGWFCVLSGTYIVYPWYRAAAPPGIADLTLYPRLLLLSQPKTAVWHSLGMEWKEHVGWLAPIGATLASAVFFQYGDSLQRQRSLRAMVLAWALLAFAAAGVAGFFGAMLNKVAPVSGGQSYQLMRSGGK